MAKTTPLWNTEPEMWKVNVTWLKLHHWDVSVVILPDFPPKEDWCSAVQLPLHCVELRILFSGHVLLSSSALWTCSNTVMNMQNPLFSGHVLLCNSALLICPNIVMNVQKSMFCNHILSCVTVIYEPAITLQWTCRIQCSVIMFSLM